MVYTTSLMNDNVMQFYIPALHMTKNPMVFLYFNKVKKLLKFLNEASKKHEMQENILP